MMDHGKDLPPLILNNTSVSCLVTLIPVLVSMTSHSEIPSYDDETDKPAWWPSDIEWRNPQFYLEDADRKNECLKVLRKLVYSCYSYHGVEDLCRLEETPVSDSEMESMENMIIQLAEDSEAVEDSSEESDGPVFVCCFCLNQFSSHDQVTTHQNNCSKRYGEAASASHFQDDTQMDSDMEPVSSRHYYVDSLLGASEYPVSSPDSESGFVNEVVSSKSLLASSHASKASSDNSRSSSSHSSSSIAQFSQASHASALLTANTSSQKRPGTAAPVPFVPTLKTRSQKKLDQIMERNNSRRLMHEECRQMREVPLNGAWWSGNKSRKCSTVSHHPNMYLFQDAFVSALGLARTSDVADMAKKNLKTEQEIDLDCEIISVEGPLSAVAPPPPPPSVAVDKTSASPRSTRSLISQLSRDNEIITRRRLSFCFVEDEWADREALNEGRDPLQISLLTLDLSSPLGQRVKKYVRGEAHLNTIKDVESYCRTELDEDGYSKLRFRGCDFRVTYRKKRRASNYVHTYKFNKSDRLEFKTLLKTGLSANSRHIQKALPVCKVVLNRLSKSEIRLWTEEKKIRISQQIVYDDDICITHIDIPESKITQGFTSDTQSPSQHQLHRKTQYLAQSSPGPVGRQCTTPDRLLLSSRMSASPPHVPNIFRNRTAFTSSPPHPSSISRPSSITSGWRPQHVIQKTQRSIGDLGSSRFNTPPLSGNRSGHQNILENNGQISDKTERNLGHLSGHKSLSPSTYALSGISETESRNIGEILGNNRRKQQLTQVRKDDGDNGGSHSAVSTNKNFIPVSMNHNSSNPTRNKGLMENNHSDAMQQHKELHPPGLPLQPSTRKLSNFDYFSIRDGKIQPSYPHNSDPVVNQHQPWAPLAPALNPHNGQNTNLHRQTCQHSRPHYHAQPPSPLSHSQHPHPRFNSTSQGAPGQARPCSLHNNNFPQHRFPSGHKKPEVFPFCRNQNGTHNVRPLQQKPVIERALMAQQLHKKNYLDDDDVMEVICIDDD